MAKEWPRIDGHTPSPWKGDRHDGTIKYVASGAQDMSVLIINNKGGGYGFQCRGDRECAPGCYQRHPADERLFFLAPSSPHLCDVPGCPGPKLVAKLEAAGALAEAVRLAVKVGHTEFLPEALAAWEAACAGEGEEG